VVFQRKKEKEERPSPAHIAFAKSAREIIGNTIKQFGFKFYRKEIISWHTSIIYRKNKQYIEIAANTHPIDAPSYYNIVLGEGDSDDFMEWDWNSVALWRIKEAVEPSAKISEYSFPRDEKIVYSLTHAKEELLKYGNTFLEGDLTLFHKIRKEQNKGREPYKIHQPDKDGVYKTTDEPNSVVQKKKYS
jgi:hypothetical protein